MTPAKVIGHCDTCGRAYAHIGFEGVRCVYSDCPGHLHWDDTADGRAEKQDMTQRVADGRWTVEPEWFE